MIIIKVDNEAMAKQPEPYDKLGYFLVKKNGSSTSLMKGFGGITASKTKQKKRSKRSTKRLNRNILWDISGNVRRKDKNAPTVFYCDALYEFLWNKAEKHRPKRKNKLINKGLRLRAYLKGNIK